jgi:hypothetical protein
MKFFFKTRPTHRAKPLHVFEAKQWRQIKLMKVAKTKKSPTTKTNQQHSREKNDFSAWKVPLSPLASQ